MKKEAEAGGFEPPVRLPVRQFSKLVVSATHPNFQSLRFLADSNRRTRFCRPLTKPLIQGTNLSFFAASFVSRLRLQRYDYFLNLQAFRWKISMKSLFFFIWTLFSMSVTSTWTPLTRVVTTPYSLETEDSSSYNPHYTKQKNDSNDYFLKIHK